MGLALLHTLTPIILIVFFLIVVLSGCVKAPPDKTPIISGYRRTPKILIGRAGVKIPFLERLDVLYLGRMAVDIKTEQSVPTTDFINVNMDVVARVKIAPDSKGIKKASRSFLNKRPEQIVMDLQDSLQGNMREVIGALTSKDINTNCGSFSDQVVVRAAADTEKLDIEILSCSIQSVTDEKGLINDLGVDNISKIKKDTAIAKAQTGRNIATAQAGANKATNDARVPANTEIAQEDNELATHQSELKVISGTKKAEADVAYEIQKRAQEKNTQITTVSAATAKAKRDSELKEQEVTVMQQALGIEINKKANAKKYRVGQAAAAELARHQREAEARKYEQEREVEAKKAVAETAEYVVEQEASSVRAKYEAETNGIALYDRTEAEARRAVSLVRAETMERRAEIYQKYNNAAMTEMLIKVLPDIAGGIVKPLAQVDKIIIIGGSGSNENGVSQLALNVPIVVGKFLESMKEATSVDLDEIMRAGTYDVKVNRNLNVTGLEHANVNTGGTAKMPVMPAGEREAAPGAPAVEPRSTNDTNSTNKHGGRKAQ